MGERGRVICLEDRLVSGRERLVLAASERARRRRLLSCGYRKEMGYGGLVLCGCLLFCVRGNGIESDAVLGRGSLF